MRRVVVLLGLLALGGAATTSGRAQAAQGKPADALEVCAIKVTGMTCGGCEAAVKIAAKQVKGVKDAKASHAKGLAEVTYDPARTTPEAIAKAIADKTGYKASVQKN